MLRCSREVFQRVRSGRLHGVLRAGRSLHRHDRDPTRPRPLPHQSGRRVEAVCFSRSIRQEKYGCCSRDPCIFAAMREEALILIGQRYRPVVDPYSSGSVTMARLSRG